MAMARTGEHRRPHPRARDDIGAVGKSGSATNTSGTFTVAGADSWGTADAFRYVYQVLPADGMIVVRVDTVQSVNAWTKAGLMLRRSLSPSSAHVDLCDAREGGRLPAALLIRRRDDEHDSCLGSGLSRARARGDDRHGIDLSGRVTLENCRAAGGVDWRSGVGRARRVEPRCDAACDGGLRQSGRL